MIEEGKDSDDIQIDNQLMRIKSESAIQGSERLETESEGPVQLSVSQYLEQEEQKNAT